jgi:hypothetical protein
VPTRDAVPGPASLNPTPPYTYCNDAYLKPPPSLPITNSASFFLTRITTSSSTFADDYYRFIGAIGGEDYNGDGFTNNNDKITFDKWKLRNGFINALGSTNDLSDVKAVYFNAGDLAFWRGMHQKTNGTRSAYYVSNFTRDVDAIDDIDGTPSPLAIATVAMEYSQIRVGTATSTNAVTKFYVFNAAGDLINNADLDGYGPKFTPGLCIECHGGDELDWSTIPIDEYETVPGAMPSFLPFDTKSFHFSNQVGSTKPDMQTPIRLLNQKSLSTYQTQAIKDFVYASYNTPNGSATLNNVNYNEIATVNNWSSTAPVNTVLPQDFYINVIGTSCRTCHASRSDPNLWFDTQASFQNQGATIASAVCGTNKYMPNAKVTFISFWTDGAVNRPNEVRKYLGLSATCN